MGVGLRELHRVADQVNSGTVSGVPAIFAAAPGPFAAGLMFRVGRADEMLAHAGITHLIEHLAMFGRDGDEYHRNGSTSDSVTQFGAVGKEADVVSFLNHVARALRSLPLDRLEAEKDILRTEAMQRGTGAFEIQRAERYGAFGPGIVTYGEIGLDTLDAARVQQWADTHFTRGNAVLWFTSNHIPDGLDLHFADGPRLDVPRWPEVARPRPAYVHGADGSVLIDAVVERAVASTMFRDIAQRMLFRALRHEGALSYTADAGYEPLDGTRARLTIYADALPNVSTAVAEGTVSVLQRLRKGDIEVRDLEAARARIGQGLEHYSSDPGTLFSLAFDFLTGAAIEHPDALVAEARSVTAADIAAVAEGFWDDALAQIPDGSLDELGFAPAPRWSSHAVEGHRYPLYGEPQFGLTIGGAGVTLDGPEGVVTVLFAHCAGYLTLPDGARTLIGTDGFRVVIEPSQYFGLSTETMAALDERVSAAVKIALTARPVEQIPAPRGKPMTWRGYRAWAGGLGAVLLVLVTGFVLPFALAMREVDDAVLRTQGDVAWGLVLVLGALVVLLFAGVRRRRRWTAVTGER